MSKVRIDDGQRRSYIIPSEKLIDAVHIESERALEKVVKLYGRGEKE